PPSITNTTPFDLAKCFEANTYGPFFALKYAPPAMAKLCEKRNYPNAEVKDVRYGSIVVVGSVAGGYGEFLGYFDSPPTSGTGVRINYISPGQIDIGVDLNKFDMRATTCEYAIERGLPPSPYPLFSPFLFIPEPPFYIRPQLITARTHSPNTTPSVSNALAYLPKLRV
ncbi:MAG: hypothetical protein Q9226_009272, partial [Calogaya cf. arnoldii]